MAKITNFDELKRLHSEARRKGASSREWIEFAIAMEDSFPAIYDKAKAMNVEFERLRNQVAVAKSIVQDGVQLMHHTQVGQWAGVRSFLEQDTADYEPFETPNVEVS